MSTATGTPDPVVNLGPPGTGGADFWLRPNTLPAPTDTMAGGSGTTWRDIVSDRVLSSAGFHYDGASGYPPYGRVDLPAGLSLLNQADIRPNGPEVTVAIRVNIPDLDYSAEYVLLSVLPSNGVGSGFIISILPGGLGTPRASSEITIRRTNGSTPIVSNADARGLEVGVFGTSFLFTLRLKPTGCSISGRSDGGTTKTVSVADGGVYTAPSAVDIYVGAGSANKPLKLEDLQVYARSLTTTQETATTDPAQPVSPPAYVPTDSVTVTVPSGTLQGGANEQATATPKDSSGNVLGGRTATWASSNTAVATVSAVGIVTGVAAGSATITATVEGKSGSVVVTVPQPVGPISTIGTGSSGTTFAPGSTTTFHPTDSGGHPITAPITWTTSAPAIATVDSTGTVTGHAAGTAVITATSGGVSVTQTVTVSLGTMTVSVDTNRIPVRGTATLTSVFHDGNGALVANAAVVWSSSDPVVATVSSTGTVTGHAAGTAVITATSGGVSVTQTVTVSLGTMTVSVDTNRIPVRGTATLTSVFHDGNGALVANAAVVWSSSDPGIATVSRAGVVYGDWVGPYGPNGYTDVTITGSYAGVSTSVVLTVYQPYAVLPDQTAPRVVPPAVVYPVLPDQTAPRVVQPAVIYAVLPDQTAPRVVPPAVVYPVLPDQTAPRVVQPAVIYPVLPDQTAPRVVPPAVVYPVLPDQTAPRVVQPAVIYAVLPDQTAPRVVPPAVVYPVLPDQTAPRVVQPAVIYPVLPDQTAPRVVPPAVVYPVLPDQTAPRVVQPAVIYPVLPDQTVARPAYPLLKRRGVMVGGSLFVFGYVDNWLTWSEPRVGGFPETGFPSGLQCAWQMPDDHFVSFDARWVEPVADGTLGPGGNSWNGPSGLRSVIDTLRGKGAVQFYTDLDNAPTQYQLATLVEPMTGGVTLENDLTRKAHLVFRSTTEFTGE